MSDWLIETFIDWLIDAVAWLMIDYHDCLFYALIDFPDYCLSNRQLLIDMFIPFDSRYLIIWLFECTDEYLIDWLNIDWLFDNR